MNPMNSGASNFTITTDSAFFFIIGISMIFLVGITGTILYFMYRYNKKKHPVATQIEGSTKLEIIWIVIPTILVIMMFFYGWNGYEPMRKPPEDSIKIKATARMWSWMFEYENGTKTDTLYVPVDTPVSLDMVSSDVIHSFYIPAFRIKEDIVPGRKNDIWFIGKEEGSYELFCTEYCGLSHSYMFTEVKVMPKQAFENWYAQTADTTKKAGETPDLAAEGKRLTELNGCVACHSADGSKLIGPSYKGIYGHKVVVVTGDKEREIAVDDEYIKRSIYEPDADVVKGFAKGQMISYKSQLKDEDVAKIIEYLKTLQ